MLGHNNPPDPIDEAIAPFGDAIAEAENWLDGQAIENDDQLKATDDLLKQIKEAKKAVNTARDAETNPLHDAWKKEVARWKPTQDDLDRIAKGIADIQNPYKQKLADQKAAEKRAAYEEAERKRLEAERAAAEAAAGDIEAQREVAAKAQEAMDAKKAASEKAKDTVKGMRTVHHHEIQDMRLVVNWIARNDKEAMALFAEDYVRRNFKDNEIDGVKKWTTKEAF